MKYNEQPVYAISTWGWKTAIKLKEPERVIWNQGRGGQLYLGKIDVDLSDKRVTTIPEDSVLYFDKSSSFPRMKLQNTKFKRCVKLDIADYIVVGHTGNNPSEKEGILYSYEKGYLFLYKYSVKDIAPSGNVDDTIRILFPNAKRVYSGIITEYDSSNQHKVAYQDGIYTKKFIYDEDLNKIVDKSYDEMTKDDVNAIVDLLKSPDPQTINLGLQMLAGFNVTKNPGLITFILHSYPRWKNLYKRTTLVDNLLNELKIGRYYVPPQITLSETLNKAASGEWEEIINTVEPIMLDNIKKMIDDYLTYIHPDKAPKLSINVEWPDCN